MQFENIVGLGNIVGLCSLRMSTSPSGVNNIVGLGRLRMATSHSEYCWFMQFENVCFPIKYHADKEHKRAHRPPSGYLTVRWLPHR